MIASTTHDLRELINQGQFRDDLYYRLVALHINIPPLRERREEIPLLVSHFLKTYAERSGKPLPELAPTAMAALTAYDWPGNVRELENVVERVVAFERRWPGARVRPAARDP